MKFLTLFLVCIIPMMLCSHHMAKDRVEYKKARLSLLSHGVPQEFTVLLGLHQPGLVFQITGDVLSHDSSKFFSEACYLKEQEVYSIPHRFKSLATTEKPGLILF